MSSERCSQSGDGSLEPLGYVAVETFKLFMTWLDTGKLLISPEEQERGTEIDSLHNVGSS
jgi:hypothetical protein